MSKDRFRVVVTGIVTHASGVLIGKKEEDDDHPFGGEWHFPGGHVDEGEEVKEALEREIKEETGLDVDIHHLVDAYITKTGALRLVYHCDSDSGDAEAQDDLEEVRWVDPEDLVDELEPSPEADIVFERSSISNLVEKLKKMPVVG